MIGGKEMDAFRNDGWIELEATVDIGRLLAAEEAIFRLYQMQATKIADYHWDCGTNIGMSAGTLRERLSYVLSRMESRDKEALYQVQKFLPQSQAVRDLFDSDLMRRAWLCLCPDLREGVMLLEGPGLFVSRPNEQRLLYKWHSEAHYYPKRRRFINVWLPIFGERTPANGSMSLLTGTHKQDWQFAEYQGYDSETIGQKHHFVQYEIPNYELGEALQMEHQVALEQGDAVFFDRNLVHRSNLNTSDEYAFAIVGRIWTPAEDLTLAGNMAVTPYGGDPGGRPGLIGSGKANAWG